LFAHGILPNNLRLLSSEDINRGLAAGKDQVKSFISSLKLSSRLLTCSLILRDTKKDNISSICQPSREFPMETSDHYIVVERMIRLGEVLMTELEHLLDSLEGQELITPSEHQTLLELARRFSDDH
jgi:hypothetical protein